MLKIRFLLYISNVYMIMKIPFEDLLNFGEGL